MGTIISTRTTEVLSETIDGIDYEFTYEFETGQNPNNVAFNGVTENGKMIGGNIDAEGGINVMMRGIEDSTDFGKINNIYNYVMTNIIISE